MEHCTVTNEQNTKNNKIVDQMEFDVNNLPTFEEWYEGVGDLKEKTLEQLYEWLGLNYTLHPFLQGSRVC